MNPFRANQNNLEKEILGWKRGRLGTAGLGIGEGLLRRHFELQVQWGEGVTGPAYNGGRKLEPRSLWGFIDLGKLS